MTVFEDLKDLLNPNSLLPSVNGEVAGLNVVSHRVQLVEQAVIAGLNGTRGIIDEEGARTARVATLTKNADAVLPPDLIGFDIANKAAVDDAFAAMVAGNNLAVGVPENTDAIIEKTDVLAEEFKTENEQPGGVAEAEGPSNVISMADWQDRNNAIADARARLAEVLAGSKQAA